MSNQIETALTDRIGNWLVAQLPAEIVAAVPVVIANRDPVRTRPCIVVYASEFKAVRPMKYTGRGKVEVFLFTQIDDTPAATHAAWASAIEPVLLNVAGMRAAMNGTTFELHDLIARDSVTAPDEARGRETTLTYDGVASACG